jgi:CheY-like chemotaxis protein/HPt (histidine-containing phosphotransfer) domain-containing protein
MRILVAEDNIVNQKVIRLLLGKLGYEADLVGDGKEVLEALGRVAYDAVLMDVQMPDMDGLEATRQITARWPPQRRPYVIGLTAHAMSEARQACLAAGMDDYLAKPVVYDKLREVLQRCWNSRVASNADSGVDEATLRRLLKLIGPEELREVIDIYFSQAAQHLSSAQRLADTGDVGEVCKIVHSLKSSSAQLGAVRVKQLCEQLEIDCRSGTVSDLRGRVAEIQTAFGLARRVLEQDRSRPAEGRATDG